MVGSLETSSLAIVCPLAVPTGCQSPSQYSVLSSAVWPDIHLSWVSWFHISAGCPFTHAPVMTSTRSLQFNSFLFSSFLCLPNSSSFPRFRALCPDFSFLFCLYLARASRDNSESWTLLLPEPYALFSNVSLLLLQLRQFNFFSALIEIKNVVPLACYLL